MRASRAVLTISMLIFSFGAAAAPPQKFTIVNPPIDTGRDGYITLAVDGDDPLACKDLTLALDDYYGLASDCDIRPGRRAHFHLIKSEKNKAVWQDVLNPLKGSVFDVKVQLAYKDKLLIWNDPADLNGKKTDAPATFHRYEPWKTMALAAFEVVLLLVFVVLGKYTGCYRDGGLPQLLSTMRPYSLGRVQFAIWTFVTLSAFVYVFVMTLATDSLNPESLVLIGISGATAVGAVSIQKSATGIASQQGLLSDLDITNQAEFKELREKVRAGESDVVKLKRTIASLKQKLQRGDVGAELKKTLDGNMAAAEERLKAAERQQEVNRDEISHVYEVAKPYMTRNLFVDMLTDGDGAAFHRFQNLMWTLVLVIFYVYTTLTTFETPKLGATLLGLMGISGGVYLGFKFNEKPGQPEEKPK